MATITSTCFDLGGDNVEGSASQIGSEVVTFMDEHVA